MILVSYKGELFGLFSHAYSNISFADNTIKRIERAIKKSTDSALSGAFTEMWR